MFNLWLERWLHLAVLDLLPVDATVEGMRTDILFAASTTTEPFLWILRQEPFADILRLLAQALRIGHVVIGDGGKQFLLILAIERWLTDEHLVQQHTVGPPIDRLTVRLVQNDLGCNVIRGTAERFRRLVAHNALLAHAEIGYLNVPVLVQQHVVELQITVHDSTRVQVEQSDGNFR
uniref:Putative secreted peptide n=1 Tax=Anopheles braziliensis TaxID=58242 RepID=A0A2M3ZMV2_9DIPT